MPTPSGNLIRRLIIALAISLLAAAPGMARPVFRADTDTPMKGGERPPASVMRLIVPHITDALPDLDTCLADNGLPAKDYAALLRSVRIRSSGGGELYLVRSAPKPLCLGLDGAHAFRFFLVAQETVGGRTRLSLLVDTKADTFLILKPVSHGLNNIETGSCLASQCWMTRMAYDGRAYKPYWCSSSTFEMGRWRAVVDKCRA